VPSPAVFQQQFGQRAAARKPAIPFPERLIDRTPGDILTADDFAVVSTWPTSAPLVERVSPSENLVDVDDRPPHDNSPR
jgi:hypothetical protein